MDDKQVSNKKGYQETEYSKKLNKPITKVESRISACGFVDNTDFEEVDATFETMSEIIAALQKSTYVWQVVCVLWEGY